jgi:hypothetical protein
MDIDSVLDAAIENVLLKRSLLKQVKSEQGSLFDMLEKYITLSEGIGVIPIVLSENDVVDLFQLSTDQEFRLAQKHEVIVEGGAKVKAVAKVAKKLKSVDASKVDKSTRSRWRTGRRNILASPEGREVAKRANISVSDTKNNPIPDSKTVDQPELKKGD